MWIIFETLINLKDNNFSTQGIVKYPRYKMISLNVKLAISVFFCGQGGMSLVFCVEKHLSN